MAVMKGKKAMIGRMIQDRRNRDARREKVNEVKKVSKEDDAERLRILREAGILK